MLDGTGDCCKFPRRCGSTQLTRSTLGLTLRPNMGVAHTHTARHTHSRNTPLAHTLAILNIQHPHQESTLAYSHAGQLTAPRGGKALTRHPTATGEVDKPNTHDPTDRPTDRHDARHGLKADTRKCNIWPRGKLTDTAPTHLAGSANPYARKTGEIQRRSTAGRGTLNGWHSLSHCGGGKTGRTRTRRTLRNSNRKATGKPSHTHTILATAARGNGLTGTKGRH